MNIPEQKQPPEPQKPAAGAPFDPVRTARELMRVSGEAALATLTEHGFPFASLVAVASTTTGEPILLISRLAQHSRNLARESKASLLFSAPPQTVDPLTAPRVTVTGFVTAKEDNPHLRWRYLARHPEAAGYAAFADFGFHRLEVTGAHLVAGFGRIVDLTPKQLLGDYEDALEVLEAEESAIQHMNEDHAEALSLYATVLLGKPPGKWRAVGIDPEGIDLRAGRDSARLWYDRPVKTAGALRKVLADLAKDARAKAAGRDR
jgi:putative heme iron utilization protein